ncbi:MAG: HNH endonuclease [Isosphaeraceae bacterium]
MTNAEKLARVAETDATFQRRGDLWVGKCLICNGPIAFEVGTGQGATLEHIRARGRGGDDDPRNLGIAHGRCNGEKGRRWDPKRRRDPEDYEAFVARLLDRRRARWREPSPVQPEPADRDRSG